MICNRPVISYPQENFKSVFTKLILFSYLLALSACEVKKSPEDNKDSAKGPGGGVGSPGGSYSLPNFVLPNQGGATVTTVNGYKVQVALGTTTSGSYVKTPKGYFVRMNLSGTVHGQ